MILFLRITLYLTLNRLSLSGARLVTETFTRPLLGRESSKSSSMLGSSERTPFVAVLGEHDIALNIGVLFGYECDVNMCAVCDV